MANTTRASANLDVEEWRAIPGRDGIYEVSDRGRVRSLDHVDPWGNHISGKLLAPYPDDHGYLRVTLGADEYHTPRKIRRVHVIVLEAFVGPRPAGMYACHDNDIKDDNRLVNLRWASPSGNQHDSVKNGHHHWANLTCCPKCGGAYRTRPSGSRYCPACNASGARRRAAAKRAATS